MLVRGRAGRLNDENVMAADVFLDFYVRLAVGKRADRCPAQWHTNVLANALGQIGVGGTAENF